METKLKVLISDDEFGVREFFKELLKDKYEVLEAENGQKALQILRSQNIDVMFLDIRMPKLNGIELLERIAEENIKVHTIIISAIDDIPTVVKAIKLGAYDYLVKPLDQQKILLLLRNLEEKIKLQEELNKMKVVTTEVITKDNIIGISKAIRKIKELIDLVKDTDATVLITGESGVGKELVAKAIHYESIRKEHLFVPIDCSTIPHTLIESELFGYEKGAFTDAKQGKIGKIELAHQGTLFLDEISNLHLDIQAKLLRFLQFKEIERIGGTKKIKLDVRVITATNRDLEKLVKEGKFREDLFYRLNVFPIHIPPLRERKEDIPILVDHFLKMYNRKYGKNVKLSRKVIDNFMEYEWPGNVRELENVISRLVILAKEDDTINSLDKLNITIAPTEDKTIEEFLKGTFRYTGKLLTLNELEKEYLIFALNKMDWNISKVAEELGISRKTIYNKLKEYGIKIPPSNK